ncbi:unnamed protein product [Closterium sp. NIES-64]|nr:unnamed protein product [Closterium sp. NIES-64]
MQYYEVPQQQNGVDCGVYVCMFSKELMGRAFQFMEEGIRHPRYSAVQCRCEIRALMCEAGEGTLLESLGLKGADIPPQSDQHGGDESDSDQGVEEVKEPTVQDLAAEQCSHAAQLKNLHEDVESLKESVYKGEQELVKVTGTMSSVFTAFQQMAAKIGFKQPTAGLEDLNTKEPANSIAAENPPHRTAGSSFEAPVDTSGARHASSAGPSHARASISATMLGYVQGHGATTGAQKSAAGHSGPAAVASTSAPGQPVAAACVTTAAAGLPGIAEGALLPSAAQPGAPAGALPSAPSQPGASAGAQAAGVGQPGAAAVKPASAGSLPGAIPAAAASQTGAAAGDTTVPTGHTGAAAGVPNASTGRTGASAGFPRGVEARAQAATGRPINAAAVQPRNDAWALVGPHTELTKFHRCVQVQGSQGSEAAADTSRALAGARAPSAMGFAQHAGAVQPAAPASAAPSWPMGHAPQPPNAVYLGSGQPHSFMQLPLSTHRPPLHHSATLLASDVVLDNASCQPAHTSASRGVGLSSMLSGFMQGSQHVLPSPAASSSMVPSTQGGEHGEVPNKKGWTGVIKKLDKDEWISRIVLDRASQSLIVINSHFGSEEETARSIVAASHVMFINKPTRGELIPLTADDKAKLRECSPH